MPIIQAQKDIRVLVDEDFSLDTVSEDFIGRKAHSLFKLRDMDVPVPPFLAISASVFSEYIKNAVLDTINEKTSDDEVRKRVLNGSFSSDLLNEIQEGYSRLSGFTDSWVAVRSSAVFPPTHRYLSFAGMLDTVLNVKGIDNVVTAMQLVYASLFTPKVLEYLHNFNLRLSDIKVAIVLQKMVQAESSGIVFTVDPISQDPNYLTIESVFGLGDVIASGDITPDQYIINKKTLEYKEKTIVPQEWMMVRNTKRSPQGPTEQKVHISKAWQHQQKLENRYVQELSKVSLLIEKKAGEPQDIEWVFEGGRLWLLQSTSALPIDLPKAFAEKELNISPEIVHAAQEIAEKEVLRQKALEAVERAKSLRQDHSEKKPETVSTAKDEIFSEKPLTRQILKGARSTSTMKSKSVVQSSPLPGERLFFTGIGASLSVERGIVLVITNSSELTAHEKTVNENTILVIPDHIEGIDRLVNKAGGVISDSGGMTSDIASRCRERRIPCIMGTHVATKMLKTGEKILVDGTVGAIYGARDIVSEYRLNQTKKDTVASPFTKHIATPEHTQQIEPVPQSVSKVTELAKVKKQQAEKPLIKTATKVFLNTLSVKGSHTLLNSLPQSDGVCVFPIENIYRELGIHPEAFIAEGKRVELIDAIRAKISDIAEVNHGNPVMVSVGSMNVSEYVKLEKSGNFEDTGEGTLTQTSRGLVRLIHHVKEVNAVLRAIRRVRNVDGWRTVSIALDYPASPSYVAEFKKMLTTAGLRRSSTFKLYLSLSTPSEAMITEDFMKAGVDGVIIDTEQLTKHMMALSPYDPSVIKIIEAIRSAVGGQQAILQVPKDHDELLKKVFKLDFYGYAVQGGELTDFRETVAKMEAERVFKR